MARITAPFRAGWRVAVLAAALVVAALGLSFAAAGSSTAVLAPGDSLTVRCEGGTRLTVSRVNTREVRLDCTGQAATPTPTRSATPTATPTRTPTPTPTRSATPPPSSGAVGRCGEPMDRWHPPVVTGPDGKPCYTGHEHGDEPPAWIAAAGYTVSFSGPFNTSPAENVDKHAAMKGFSTRLNGVDIYFRVHAASNPLDRMSRYHSYQVWARDPSGNVSFWQGWYNSGDPRPASEGGSRVPRRVIALPEEAQRPIVAVCDATSIAQGIGCEQWYSAPGEPDWSWDFGWTICGTTTLYTPGENATAYDISTWIPTGETGNTRRLEAAWYAFRNPIRGAFVATQFGEIVSGHNDPRCSGTTTRYGITYQNVCLDQYIAPTMPTVAFPGNADQKTYPDPGVTIPN